MDQPLRKSFDELRSKDRALQYEAFQHVLQVTDRPVDWSYEVWDEMIAMLSSKDNHERAIAAQVLCNLARSDPQESMLKDLPALLRLTKDERFVTARHCMQALWKLGVAGKKQRVTLTRGLERRFQECSREKNRTLIRYDIEQSLRSVYDGTQDETVRAKALELIETESDLKYRKKYSTLWSRKIT